MQLPSCAECGAPLPAVPADPAHPERCGACSARAVPGGVPGLPPMPPTVAPAAAQPNVPTAAGALPLGVDRPTLVVRSHPAAGLLVGSATAVVAGLLWWAFASLLAFEWWTFGAAVVGLLIGEGVLQGARRGGPVPAVIAAVLGLAVVGLAVYFIDRSLAIDAINEAGRSSDVPLWQGASAFWDDLRSWFEVDRTKALGFLLAPLVALVVAVRPNGRPLGARG